MQELLHHPAVQGGLVPFGVALLAAVLLQPLRLSGLAVILGFAATVYLDNGFSLDFSSLKTFQKIVWLGSVAALAAIPLALFNAAWIRPLLTAAGGASALWVAERILQQHQLAQMFLWGAGIALYAGWLVFWMDKLGEQPVRAGSAGLALGLGTGLAVLFGGYASLGLYGVALGAAAGAYVLIQMITNSRLPCGYTFTLPLALLAGLAGSYAVLSVKLPWYALLPLAAIPLAAKIIPVSEKVALWLQSTLLSAATLACAAGAVFLTWRVAGAPPF
ncbi:MAG TPA: hypothetical protein VIU46_11515 [Gallionellaceae bacterium]